MQYRQLGGTGLRVSEISLGSWLTFGGSVEKKLSIRIIRRAFELGVNLFDTADVYSRGEAERILGEALKELPREQVVVASKTHWPVWEGPLGYGLSRKHIRDAIDHSLSRLGLEYLDLYQLHNVDDTAPLEETISMMDDLVRLGRILYWGVSNYDTELTRDILEICDAGGWERPVSSQPPYNMLKREIEATLIPRCEAEGIGILAYSPLAQGVLTGKYAQGQTPPESRGASPRYGKFVERYLSPETFEKVEQLPEVAARKGLTPAQLALAWILRQPAVSSCIVGATSQEQLDENVEASAVRLDEDETAAIERILTS
jgi:aryl-alcohol dehydrogenase-like predicted oxidoreductase